VPRRIFPAGTVTNTTGAALRLTFYATSTTNRRETDLWTIDSSNNLSERIPNGVILTDTAGAYSAFAGPDDIDVLYLNSHTGVSRSAITATGTVPSGDYLSRTFKPEEYGALGNGSTDDSAAVIAAIAAAYAAGGGTVEFGPKTYRIDSQLAIPNDAHSTIARQPPIRLRGAGATWDGSWQAQGTMPGATILDLRSTTGPAKIDTRGLGALTIEQMTLTQLTGASDTNPFIQTTNTTIFVRDVAFYGHSTLTGATCVQDAIVFGGTSTTAGNLSTSCFQGYGSVVERCHFARIQRGAYLRVYANSIRITNNTWSNSCGAGSSAAAVHLDGTTGFCKANVIRDNLFEVSGYVYVIRFKNSSANVAIGNQFWDPSVNLLGVFYFEGTAANCVGNRLGSQLTGVTDNTTWVVDGTGGAPGYYFENGYQIISSGDFLSGKTTIVKPLLATGSESTSLLQVNRSGSEASNAGSTAFNVKQSGSTTIGASWSSGANLIITNSTAVTTYDSTSVVKNSGNLDLYGGSGGTDVVRIRRGILQADTGIRHSGAGPTWTTGTGTPEGAVTAPIGSLFSRTDGGAGTSLYVKESGAGNTGWVGK
jgi:hypothetical protein